MLQEKTTLPNGTSIEDTNGAIYIVEATLGQGGFSAVYRVREQQGQKGIFALKETIDPTALGRHSLALEAEILMSLDHPSLPHVYKVFENVKLKRIFMLMDFIDGKNLEVLRQEQPKQLFSLSQTLTLMTPIVDAISYLHTRQQPIVHRDIKPANIIIPMEGTNAQLVDFGLAKEYVEDKTTGSFRGGTPGYAAPEQYTKGTNHQTDVYALGATLYTLLTGSIPADALSRSINQQGTDPFQSANKICPSVPEAVSKIIDQAMMLRATSRFATVEEFWHTLCLAAIPYADIPRHTGDLASNKPADLFSPVNVVMPSLVSKAPITPHTQPIGSFRYSHTFRRMALLLIALVIVIISSVGIWSRSMLPAIEGSKATQQSSLSQKHAGSTALQNTSPTTITNSTVNTANSKTASTSSTGDTHSSILSSPPAPANTQVPPPPVNTSVPPAPAHTPVPPAPAHTPVSTADCISSSPTKLIFTSLKLGGNPASEVLTIINCGGNSAWSATTQTTDGASWLSISPSQGTIPPNSSEDIQVMVQNDSLAYGPYRGSINFSQGTASLQVIIVNHVKKN